MGQTIGFCGLSPSLNHNALHSQTPPSLDSGGNPGLRDVAFSRLPPASGRLDRRQNPIVCPTSLPATRRATRPGAIRSCLLAGFTGRAGGGGRSALWRDGARVLLTPRVGGHAQSRPRDFATACCNAHRNAMAQRENQQSGRPDSGTHWDGPLARRVIRPLDTICGGAKRSDRIRGKQPGKGGPGRI